MENQQLLEIKKNTADLVARTNGKMVITRKFVGGKTNKWKKVKMHYELPVSFKPLRMRIEEVKMKSINAFLDKLYIMQNDSEGKQLKQSIYNG